MGQQLMPGPSIDPLSQMLGAMDAKLEMVLKVQAEDRESSAKYRTDIRREVGEVKDTVKDLKNRVDNTADDLANLRPDVEDYRLMKNQGLGMWNIARALWVICIALGAGGLGVIIHALWPPK